MSNHGWQAAQEAEKRAREEALGESEVKRLEKERKKQEKEMQKQQQRQVLVRVELQFHVSSAEAIL